MHLFSWLLPVAVDLFRAYINNTDSKKDDMVLKIVQDGARYLACKDNNNLTHYVSNLLDDKKITK